MLKMVIEKLSASHTLDAFDCGVADLNRFLIKHARQSQHGNSVNTYVACDANKIVGFYSLTVGSVIHAQATSRMLKGQAKHPVPVMILARLAVDKNAQKKGIGRGLLKDVLLRMVQASEIVGMRALLVHAKDEDSKNGYKQFGFEESPTDSLHLFLLMKNVKELIEG